MSRLASLASLALASLLAGCAGAAKVTRPPGEPPTPQSVTASNPGGDAFDPELAALDRLFQSPWGARADRWKTFRAAMPDWRNWSTVNVFGFKPRAVYRYGEDNYAAGALVYKAIEGVNDPERCLKKVIDDNLSSAQAFGIHPTFGDVVRSTYTFQGLDAPMATQNVEGYIENLFASDDYVGALAAYQSWPGTCFVYAFAVKSTHHPKLARAVRDRWVADGAPKTRWEPKLKEAPALDPPEPVAPPKDEKKKDPKKDLKKENDKKKAVSRPGKKRPNKLARPKPTLQPSPSGPEPAPRPAPAAKPKPAKPALEEGGVRSTL